MTIDDLIKTKRTNRIKCAEYVAKFWRVRQRLPRITKLAYKLDLPVDIEEETLINSLISKGC